MNLAPAGGCFPVAKLVIFDAWSDSEQKGNIQMEDAVGTGVGLLMGILILAVFGAIVGWLAGLVVKGSGFGLLGDIVIGIVGANIAGWLFPVLGIPVGQSIVGAIIAAVVGAVLLLLVIKLIRQVV